MTIAATVLAAVIAEPRTRPRMGEEDHLTEERALIPAPFHAVEIHPSRLDDDEDKDVDVDDYAIDETELALAAEPESEILGTSARTARRVAARQAVEGAVYAATLTGNIRLVHHHGARFME